MAQIAWIKHSSLKKKKKDSITTSGCFSLPGLDRQQATCGRLAKTISSTNPPKGLNLHLQNQISLKNAVNLFSDGWCNSRNIKNGWNLYQCSMFSHKFLDIFNEGVSLWFLQNNFHEPHYHKIAVVMAKKELWDFALVLAYAKAFK